APTVLSPLPLPDALPISTPTLPVACLLLPAVRHCRLPVAGCRLPVPCSLFPVFRRPPPVPFVQDRCLKQLSDDGSARQQPSPGRSEEHTSELQSRVDLVC